MFKTEGVESYELSEIDGKTGTIIVDRFQEWQTVIFETDEGARYVLFTEEDD